MDRTQRQDGPAITDIALVTLGWVGAIAAIVVSSTSSIVAAVITLLALTVFVWTAAYVAIAPSGGRWILKSAALVAAAFIAVFFSNIIESVNSVLVPLVAAVGALVRDLSNRWRMAALAAMVTLAVAVYGG